MRTSDRDREKTNPHDLIHLRKRLWRLSSVLTCGVLIVALAATWIASAVTAREVNNAELANLRAESVFGKKLLAAKYMAEGSALDALSVAFDRKAAETDPFEGYLPSGSAPDSKVELSSPVQTPFSVLVFEDGGMTFSVPPTNVIANDEGPEGSWNEWAVANLVEDAISARAEGNRHMRPQYVKIGDMTWQWTTWVTVVNMNAEDEDEGISFYSSGDLADYSKDGYLAARLFTFSDITPSAQQLERLAVILAGAGLLGCALLTFVSRKIIDRALVPVAESQARQREFLIKASHELKTPMASLSSNLDALVANADESVASQAHWTGNMRKDIDELADRTCKLLDLVTRAGDEGADEGADAGGEEVEGAGER